VADAGGREPGELRFAPRDPLAPGGGRYAPWWRRFTAFVLDASTVATLVLAFLVPIFVLFGLRDTDHDRTQARWLLGLATAATVAFGLVYAIVLEGRNGQTWGKRAVGIRVLAEDGTPCGYGKAASRELLGRLVIGGISWLLVLPGMLGYLAALWDPRRQAWHDKLGETIVVRVERQVGLAADDAPAPLTAVARAPTLMA
jgi:uncharacterized RDD family membrane protein YckC